MDKNEIAELILKTLEGQRFADWYSAGGDFDDYVVGETNRKSKEEILEDIKEIFHL